MKFTILQRTALMLLGLMVLVVAALAEGYPGALWTTDVGGTVDKNIYDAKIDVYVNGGPHGGAGNGALPANETFYIRVIAPGGTPLGTSVGTANERPVGTTATGNFIIPYHLWDVVKEQAPDGTFTGNDGFADTDNAGGEYKVEISLSPDFTNAKSDNFKVYQNEVQPPQSQLEIKKFYDTNANGVQDAGEPDIFGWKVHITYGSGSTLVDEDTFTSAVYSIPDGMSVTVYEYQSLTGSWFASTPISFTFDMPAGGTTVKFGNYARGPVTGGLTIGFWSNKNGYAILNANAIASMTTLNNLNLKNANGSDATFALSSTGVKAYQSWLLNATATNMAYMLSAQLSAMQNNVSYNSLNPNTIIYVPSGDTTGAGAPIGQTLFNNGANIFPAVGGWTITVADLMTAANNSLGANPLTNTAGTARTYQDCLKTLIDQMNNNGSFGGIGVILPPVPPFSF